ncbi:Protein of unknown function [Flagellimonas taeanensis]|uniref:Conjugative transposon TraM C-terminal domain-containing protein n=1 Tax=Flagellimonas taeanensis TaxID=1005926 RepID=A0A1M6X9P2_9FLAO|nr:conjugative transposon protein TraM [Allomuricauda taeanensis]SFB96666.1 Protein of unknown function [Allomuricauda taeanensis]SHL02644.1 Protein of unknown function [Allomuricauda taeanensis]
MKPQKNKIVFVLVMVCVVLFTTAYGILTFGKNKREELTPDRIPLPDLEDNQQVYGTKLEALEAIEEERESTAPPIYPDHMVDDKGYFNPDYMEYEKQRIIDSVYASTNHGQISTPLERREETVQVQKLVERKENAGSKPAGTLLSVGEPALRHQLFFASNPKQVIGMGNTREQIGVLVHVDGDQVVREGHRLALRLARETKIQDRTFPKGTKVYAFVKIRPNRVMVSLDQMNGTPMALKGYDLQDGREGIYIENHLAGAVIERGMDRAMDGVDLPGLPRLNGIGQIFKRDHRAVKVALGNQYQFILKPGS